jgi:hypothetical protein
MYLYSMYISIYYISYLLGGRRGHVVVGITTSYAISAYQHESYEFESRSWQGVINTTLCHKVCQ